MLRILSVVIAELLAADAPRTTAGGATFTVPAGWSLTAKGNVRLIDGPEPDLHVALVDVKAADAEHAVAAAWPQLTPKFSRPLKITLPRPARQGWDERRVFVYETSPDERRAVSAGAYRKGDAWTVVLTDAAQPALQRRGAAFDLLVGSLRPAGYKRESFAGKKAHALDAARLQQLADFIEQGRAQTGTPGVAIALWQDGKVILERGFGVRELGKPTPVDADTQFIIASNTKALTTLMLAKLVDQHKLAWDMPVMKVYPKFRLGDVATSAKVLVKHLVCACTGLPRQDFEWLFEFKGTSALDEMARVASFQPTTKFGEAYQYSNLLASAGGFVGAYALEPARELGAGYDAAMRALVFDPLGMKQTTFDFARALAGNHAAPHAEDVDGKPQVASMDINYGVVPLRPAGGAWSSARELLRYVAMELAGGTLPDGKRYVSSENLLARRKPQVASGEDSTYGMGLVVDRQYGVPVVMHGGSMIGFKSQMFWLPENGVGGVILTNADAGALLTRSFPRRVLEVLFDGNPEAVEDLKSGAEQRMKRIKKDRERLTLPPDAAITTHLAARYKNAALGEIGVSGDKLDFGEWKSRFATRKNDDGTVSLYTTDPGVDGFTFVVGSHDGKRTLTLRDAQHEYRFAEN
jgi:CubicO group peptidase (beta-lactamase class C family)